MADISQNVFAKNLCLLLKETFEGAGGSVYLDKGAGLFQTLDALTAEAASHVPCAGGQTIAAHCAHLTYYVRVNHNYARTAPRPRPSWTSPHRHARESIDAQARGDGEEGRAEQALITFQTEIVSA